MKKLTILLLIVYCSLLISPAPALTSTCNTSVEHPQVNQPCSSGCQTKNPMTGIDAATGKTVTTYFCGTVKDDANPSGTTDPIGSPKSWLPQIVPGNGVLPIGGITFITGKLIPFLIQGSLMLVIILSLIFVIIGGIMWITGGGDKEAMTKAKSTVTHALIGLALAFSAIIIWNIINTFIFGSSTPIPGSGSLNLK